MSTTDALFGYDSDSLDPLPATFAATRDALHSVAEHVVCVARHRVTGRIGLRATPGGFGTPFYGDDEQVRVDGDEVVYVRGRESRRARITTLGAAADFVGVPLGAPSEVFKPTTPCDADALLAIERSGAHVLAQWYDFAASVLTQLREEYDAHTPSELQLWPEHFDLGLDFGDAEAGTRANYGASPGDGLIAEPYLYVGPWDAARRVGELGEYPFGAALPYRRLLEADDPRAEALGFVRRAAGTVLA